LAEDQSFDSLVSVNSAEADLVITGFSIGKMKQDEGEFLKGFENIQDLLFVRAGQDILIAENDE
ncbi:hypothetical protein LLH00_10075, partial [bacterium]|nr:hypothetical protein [bacterium]